MLNYTAQCQEKPYYELWPTRRDGAPLSPHRNTTPHPLTPSLHGQATTTQAGPEICSPLVPGKTAGLGGHVKSPLYPQQGSDL